METKKCNVRRYIGKTANNIIIAQYGEHDCDCPRRKTEFQICQFHFAQQKARVNRIDFVEADSILFRDLTGKFINSATTVSFDNTIEAPNLLREKYPAVDVFVNSYSQVKHKIVRCFLKSSRPIQSSSLAETSNWRNKGNRHRHKVRLKKIFQSGKWLVCSSQFQVWQK